MMRIELKKGQLLKVGLVDQPFLSTPTMIVDVHGGECIKVDASTMQLRAFAHQILNLGNEHDGIDVDQRPLSEPWITEFDGWDVEVYGHYKHGVLYSASFDVEAVFIHGGYRDIAHRFDAVAFEKHMIVLCREEYDRTRHEDAA